MKRILALGLAMLMLLACLSGCGSNDGDQIQENDGQDATADVPEGRIGVTYWSTYGSDNKAYVQSVIDSFNASQGTYYVTMQYVGNRNDLHAKLQVTEKSKLPAMINNTTEMVGAYMYSDYIVPIYEVAGAEDQSYLDRVYGNLVGTWGDADGNLLGYPMGNSMSGVYFNMDVLNRAGIDPYTEFKTVEDLYEICKKLADGGYVSGKVVGFEHTIRFMNYSIAMEGVHAFDNGNGLEAIPTTSYYNTSPVKELCTEYFNVFKKINDEGLCYTMGASWGNELLPAYATGEIAVLTGTIGGYGRLERAWNDSSSTPINTVFLPWVPITEDANPTGQPASGNGFYVIDNGDPDEQKGAWEFIKYFCSGENFAGWCVLTGYLPIADDILSTSTYQQYMADHPNLGLEYLMQVQREDDGSVYHPVSAVYSETSDIGLDKLNKYISGTDIDTCLNELEMETNDAITMWNLANAK